VGLNSLKSLNLTNVYPNNKNRNKNKNNKNNKVKSKPLELRSRVKNNRQSTVAYFLVNMQLFGIISLLVLIVCSESLCSSLLNAIKQLNWKHITLLEKQTSHSMFKTFFINGISLKIQQVNKSCENTFRLIINLDDAIPTDTLTCLRQSSIPYTLLLLGKQDTIETKITSTKGFYDN
jgi:hypothetical protein